MTPDTEYIVAKKTLLTNAFIYRYDPILLRYDYVQDIDAQCFFITDDHQTVIIGEDFVPAAEHWEFNTTGNDRFSKVDDYSFTSSNLYDTEQVIISEDKQFVVFFEFFRVLKFDGD